MYAKLNIDHYCESESHSDEAYGPWETVYSFHVGTKAKVVEESGYKVEPLPSGVSRGDVVFAIIANYSTGDSFGMAERGDYDVVCIVKYLDKAKEILKILKTPALSNDFDARLVKFTLDNDSEVAYHRPWLGYFESLDSLEIYPIILE
jgi:hypothetical protein